VVNGGVAAVEGGRESPSDEGLPQGAGDLYDAQLVKQYKKINKK
jgi:hypothetical protein